MTVSSVCRALLVAPLAVLGLVACSGTTTNPDAGVTVLPSDATVKITAPAEGAAVTLDSSATVQVASEVSGFTLKEIGTCGEDPDCGHAELLVDGYQCDAPGKNYNNTAIKSPVLAQLSSCPVAKGTHRLTVELHRDDGSVVVGQSGQFVADTVSVESSPPPPSLAIVAPTGGSTLYVGPDLAVDIAFDAQNVTLTSAPGECNGNPACGVLILNVDGDACNDPNIPVPVNNFGATAGSIAAQLGYCASAPGSHTATLMVLDEGGQNPLMVDGQPLMAQVQFNVLLAPTLTITSPTEGETVTLGGDAQNTVPIAFTTTNLTLTANPGMCGGDPSCGVLIVTIDGFDDGCINTDLGGPPFNNYGATSTSIDSFFSYCGSPTGPHAVTLTVLDNAGQNPLLVNGVPLAATVNITTQ
jgi:hypothetical protein